MKLNDRVIIIHRPEATVDGYRNEAYDWTTAGRTQAAGSLQPVSSSETDDGRQAVVSSHVLFLAPSAAITAVDRVELDGQIYEVAGDPEIWRTHGQPHHQTVPLKRITG